MAVFSGIIIQHIYKRVAALKMMKRFIKLAHNQKPDQDIVLEGHEQECTVSQPVTTQVVSIRELKEPLIAMEQTE